MKKFGFSKRDKDGGDRSKNSSPAPSANPYAVQGGSDPYAQPPPSYSNNGPANDRYRDQKSASVTGQGARYGTGGGSYDSSGGYGSSRYGQSEGGDNAAPTSRYGPGGYGGLGGPPPAEGNRYGGAPSGGLPSGPSPSGNRFGGGNEPPSTSRYGGGGNEPQSNSRYGGGAGNEPQGGSRYGSGQSYGNVGTAGAAYGGGAPNRYNSAVQQDEAGQQSSWESGHGAGEAQGYGAYSDRQLTAEEQEEEDVQGLKDEIRQIKKEDVSSTRNALRIAQMAEESGRGTLERLQQQGERIHNTERNLDLASNQNRLAAEKAREIKTLNRSMFAVHVANPFTSKQRVREREEQVLSDAQADRERRDATRAAAWSSNDRNQRLGMEMNKAGQSGTSGKKSLAERSKYQFEADSEDEDMENEIDNNIDLLAGAAGRMKIIAGAMGSEIESQNKHIDRIGGKVDRVDDEIALNRSRLDRIK